MDEQSLKHLYEQGTTTERAFLANASKRKNGVSQTNIDRLQSLLLQEENVTSSRRELVELLKKLERFGCGRFITGRRGKPTRFAWTQDIGEVGRRATNGKPIPPNDIAKTADELKSAGETSDAPSALSHRFQLRATWPVEFSLPWDLTNNEANRLADFIKTLPFA